MCSARAALGLWATLGVLILLAGCATPRIDWNSRIGIYTHDQAILDFGPPDKSAKLQDGTVVAEWLTRRGRSYSYAPFAYTYSPWYGPYYGGGFYPYYVDAYSPDYFLRLVFGPDARLRTWKEFYK